MRAFAVLLAVLVAGSSWAGDWGGGSSLQDLQRDLRLSRDQMQRLQRARDKNEAFYLWIDSLEQRKQEKVFRKLFEGYIVPQIGD